MHHFRGRLREGEQPRLDPANVYIEYLGPQDGTRPNWNGYIVVGSESELEVGNEYTLALDDGRTGTLAIEHVEPDDSGRFRAVFTGETPLA